MASSELLKAIQAGKKLKKAETNDRSGPAIDPKPSGGGAGRGAGGGSLGAGSATTAATGPGFGGPPQLGGLFAGGMPKLKPAGPAKPLSLGKPPSIPRRDTSPIAPPPPPPERPPPPTRLSVATPDIPNRPPPKNLPSRVAPEPPASTPSPSRKVPQPPDRSTPPAPPPPPARPSSRLPPAIPERNASPISQPTSSGISRPVPSIPTSQESAQSLTLNRNVPPPPAAPGRAPPPPPPRPSSTPSPSRVAPTPPPRRVADLNGPPAPPSRVSSLSETQLSSPSPPGPPLARSLLSSLGPPPPRPRTTSYESGMPLSLPSSRRTASVANPNGIPHGNTSVSRSRGRIPSPPASAGLHNFPVSGFPPPRVFNPKMRQYGGGRQRGSNFDLGSL